MVNYLFMTINVFINVMDYFNITNPMEIFKILPANLVYKNVLLDFLVLYILLRQIFIYVQNVYLHVIHVKAKMNAFHVFNHFFIMIYNTLA